MRTLHRVTWLGCFAAMGAGVAVCLATAEPKPAERLESKLAVRVVTEAPDDSRSDGAGSQRPASLSPCQSQAVFIEPELTGPGAPDSADDSRGAANGGSSAAIEPVELPRLAMIGRSSAGGPTPPASPDRLSPGVGTEPGLPATGGADSSWAGSPPGPSSYAQQPSGPAYGQQIVPGPGSERLQQVLDFLRSELGPGQAPGAGAAAAPAPAGGATAEPVLAPPGSPAAGHGAPARRAAVAGGADGRLTIHFPDNDIREVLEVLSEEGGLNILASKNVQGKVTASLTGVDINSALEAILRSNGYVAKRDGNYVFVGTPEDFATMEQSLDRVGTRVYRPNYITAAELQKLIQPILSEKIGVVSVSTPAEAGIGSDANTAGGNNYAGGEVVLVRDYEAVLAQVDQLVQEVDVRPMQVHIEAMILSVKLKDEDSYGVNFQLLRDNPNIKFGLGNPPSSLANFKFEDGALKFGFLDSSLGAFLSALESIGDTNVIATPRLMVINKHRAEIQIGESKGYVSTTVTETSTSQTVEFLEVGALLRLRPFISSDGLIRMEVHPELSDGTVKIEQGFTLPEKEVTQVTTNIMVADGCTVVIGGLMRENLVTVRNQIPLLGNLPLVGVAFRTSKETTERREVLVLITPRIVYEPGTCIEGDKAAGEAHRRQSVYFDKMSTFNKRSIARRYFRLAQSAWAAGQRDKALRWAEMAVHFDSLNRAAIELRSDIWTGRRDGDHTLAAELATGAMPGSPANPLDAEQMPDWLIDQLQTAPPVAGPNHPLDPGRPGGHRDIAVPRRLP